MGFAILVGLGMILASLVIWAIRIKPLAIRNRLNVKSGANLGWSVWADYTEVSEYLRANGKKDQMIRWLVLVRASERLAKWEHLRQNKTQGKTIILLRAGGDLGLRDDRFGSNSF